MWAPIPTSDLGPITAATATAPIGTELGAAPGARLHGACSAQPNLLPAHLDVLPRLARAATSRARPHRRPRLRPELRLAWRRGDVRAPPLLRALPAFDALELLRREVILAQRRPSAPRPCVVKGPPSRGAPCMGNGGGGRDSVCLHASGRVCGRVAISSPPPRGRKRSRFRRSTPLIGPSPRGARPSRGRAR